MFLQISVDFQVIIGLLQVENSTARHIIELLTVVEHYQSGLYLRVHLGKLD